MDRSQLKLDIFVDLSVKLSTLSACKLASVGAVVTDRSFRGVHSIGYNGPPRGSPNDSCTGVRGACGCAHAEANAVIKLGAVTDCLLITTVSPCPLCAGLIANCEKITEVLYLDQYRLTEGLVTLDNAGIKHARIT